LKKIIVLLIIIISLNFGCSTIDCTKIEWISYEEKIVGFNGKPLTGKCKFFYENGDIRSRREYLTGKYHGPWKFYYENGEIETQGQYNKGKKTGEWKYFYENGKIKQVSYYKDGEGVGVWKKFDEDGNLYWGKNWGKPIN
tara:strand:- start:1341 stop:1760 length:420 start_codon:yes stop_codon:yes gene_type:complete